MDTQGRLDKYVVLYIYGYLVFSNILHLIDVTIMVLSWMRIWVNGEEVKERMGIRIEINHNHYDTRHMALCGSLSCLLTQSTRNRMGKVNNGKH